MQKLVNPADVGMADARKIKMLGQRIEGMMRAADENDRRVTQVAEILIKVEEALTHLEDKVASVNVAIAELRRDQHAPVDIVAIVEEVIKEKGLRPPQKRGPKPKKTQPHGDNQQA